MENSDPTKPVSRSKQARTNESIPQPYPFISHAAFHRGRAHAQAQLRSAADRRARGLSSSATGLRWPSAARLIARARLLKSEEALCGCVVTLMEEEEDIE
jgi:hypothetical protein